MNRSRPTRVLIAAVAVALLASGCGDDDDEANEATEETSTSEASDEAGEVVEVTAVDYKFEGLPDTVEAGTKFSLTNTSEKELHEFVAFALPDGEEREVDELVKLPQDELEGLFGGPPAAVLLAPPGSKPQIAAVGDGTLVEPGRFIVLCAIPTGADPQAYLDAARESQEGPPDVPGGPPHFTRGMYGEVTVE